MALDVYLTNACNLRCKFCFNLDREDAPRIPLEDICAILKAAYDRGNRYVSITGGEPFIYKQIFEVIEYAHGLGYWINILSHAGLLNDEKIRRLKKFWRLRIRVSLDGADSATHDLLRGAGTFDNTIDKIDRLVAEGVSVGVARRCRENNIGNVDEIVPPVHRSRHFNFVRFTPVARVKKGRSAQVTAALHEELIERIASTVAAAIWTSSICQRAAPDVPLAIDTLTTRRCMAGKKFFGITPDKKILPCPLLIESAEIGSETFEDGESFQRLGDRMDALFEGHEGQSGRHLRHLRFPQRVLRRLSGRKAVVRPRAGRRAAGLHQAHPGTAGRTFRARGREAPDERLGRQVAPVAGRGRYPRLHAPRPVLEREFQTGRPLAVHRDEVPAMSDRPRKRKARTAMTADAFMQTELPQLAEVVSFCNNLPVSLYADTTGVKSPEVSYRGLLLSRTDGVADDYLLNARRSEADIGIVVGVNNLRAAFGAGGDRDARRRRGRGRGNCAAEAKDAARAAWPRCPQPPQRARLHGRRRRLGELATILFHGGGVTGELEMPPGAESETLDPATACRCARSRRGAGFIRWTCISRPGR